MMNACTVYEKINQHFAIWGWLSVALNSFWGIIMGYAKKWNDHEQAASSQ